MAKQYEYDFVRVDLTSFTKKSKQDWHEIVQSYAQRGWRLKQVFAPPVDGYGLAAWFELIFEREL